jgi:hypothetical protein
MVQQHKKNPNDNPTKSPTRKKGNGQIAIKFYPKSFKNILAAQIATKIFTMGHDRTID